MIDSRKTKNEVEYQATPNRRMRCEVCARFVHPDACKAIKGPISQRGWCKHYESLRQVKA